MIKPKLALIPSGYSDGKVFSVLPENGDGDFTFSRGSNATRVNKDGLIEIMPLGLGEELVTNGSFATDSDWIKETGWTISGGKANANVSSYNSLNQTGISLGKHYKATFTVSGYSSGRIKLMTGTSSNPTYRTSNGTFTEYLYSSGTAQIRLDSGGQTFVGSIDNVSIKEVISGYDTPRLDYTDSSCPSLLLEPQRTNLIPYSEDFVISDWTKNAGTTITNNYAISPDGTLNASRYLGTGSSGLGDKFTLSATDYTISFWVKSNNGVSQFCRLIGDSSNVSSNLLITTEWTRLSYTFTGSGLSNKTNGIFRDSDDNDIDILIYGAQLEQGSYATSYISTNGAVATRYADECTDAGTSDTFNDSEGVLMAEISALANDSTFRTIAINGTATNVNTNRVQMYFRDTADIITFGMESENSSQFFLQFPLDVKSNNKLALKYSASSCSFWINGIKVGEETNKVMPTGLLRLDFVRQDGNDEFFYGNTKQLQYFQTALTDSELEELTSWESFILMANGQNYTIK